MILAQFLGLHKETFTHRSYHAGMGQVVGLLSLLYATYDIASHFSFSWVLLTLIWITVGSMFAQIPRIPILCFLLVLAIAQPWFILTVVMYFLSGVSVTAFFHRYCAHRSWDTHTWLKRAMLFFASIVGSGSSKNWAAAHPSHHKYSDDPDCDPHNVRSWKSAWLINYTRPPKYAYHAALKLEREDSWHSFFHYNYWLINFAVAFGAFLISPYCLLYGYLLPMGTLLIMGGVHNVIAHAGDGIVRYPINVEGYRPFSFGEWRHGDHHARPQDPNFGEGDLAYEHFIRHVRTDHPYRASATT